MTLLSLALLLALVASGAPAPALGANCTAGDSCQDCAKAGCVFCASRGACVGSATSCDDPGCVFSAAGPHCTAANPGSLDSCGACAGTGLGWCALDATCNYVDPAGGQQCSDSSCQDHPECWKNTAGGHCSAASPDQIDNCGACVAGGFGWCAEESWCYETDNNGGPNCADTECVNLPQCWKSKQDTHCASTTPDQIDNCGACVASGFGWCASETQCYETDNTGGMSCVSTGCQSLPACWKSQSGPHCPSADPSSFGDCVSCTSSGFGWCDVEQWCYETDNNGGMTCVDTECVSQPNYWITAPASCPPDALRPRH